MSFWAAATANWFNSCNFCFKPRMYFDASNITEVLRRCKNKQNIPSYLNAGTLIYKFSYNIILREKKITREDSIIYLDHIII